MRFTTGRPACPHILNFKTQVYVLKRPFVDDFLAFLANKFECVLFTASLAKYADPVSDLLDVHGCFSARLFREACIFHKGNYVKVCRTFSVADHFFCGNFSSSINLNEQ